MEKALKNVEGYQLSINQMNLWSIASPNIHHFHNQVVINLSSDLTKEKVERAIALVIRKNETLQFKMSGTRSEGFPIQIVSQEQEIEMFEQNVQALDEVDIVTIAQECLGYDYDPFKNNAVRFCLLRDLKGNQVLIFRLFALWGDSYSSTFLFEELRKAITDEAFYEQEEREVVEYQNFSVWQHQLFNEPEEEGYNFWKNYKFNLTKDLIPFKSKKGNPFVPKRKKLSAIDGDEYRKLKTKSLQQGCSLEHLILSQFAIYLSRFDDEDSFTLGHLPFKRSYKELENTFGLVSKILPAHLRDLKLLQKIEVGAFIQKAVEELGMWSDYFYVNRIHNKEKIDSTIFKYVYEFIEVHPNENLKDLEISDVYSVTDLFELKINAIDYGDRFVIDLYYDATIFSEELIALIAAQLNTAFLDQNISISGKRIIDSSNSTLQQFESFTSITELFAQQATLHLNKTALFTNDTTISYQELDEKSNQLANYLNQKCGIRRGDPVAILLDRTPFFVISVLGILKAGAYYIPMDTAYPKDRIRFILEDSNCGTLISVPTSATYENFPEVEILDPSDEKLYVTNGNLSSPNELNPDDIAYCIYTSGSTGNPKGCLISHANLLNYIQWANDYYFKNKDIGNWGLFTSVSFDLTITSLFSSLTRGKKLWIGSDAKGIDELLLESFSHPEIDTLKLTPSHLSLLKELKIKETYIKIIICGGEPLNQNQLESIWNIDPSIRIFNEYGPTETTVGCIVKEMVNDQSQVLIGSPIANTVVDIVDNQGRSCDIGMYGELQIAGDGVSKGYLNRSELTKDRFVMVNGKLSYRTGDIARWMPHGEIAYKERKDDQVKIRGHRIELGEIEQQLLRHKSIIHAVAVVDNSNNKKQVVAYVVKSPNEDIKNLKKFLERNLPEYMIPSYFIELDTIPLTVNGKVDKGYLLKLNKRGTLSSVDYVAPVNELEKQITTIWKDILQQENVGTQDDFFELGGHSLKAAQLINKYHKAFEVKLGLKEIFSLTTVKEHANLIEKSEVTGHTSIQKIEEGEDYPVSDGQRRLWVLSQFTEETEVYNMPFRLNLKGIYNVNCFSKAIEAAIERHEVLRTVFKVNDEGEVRQVVKTIKELDFSLKYLDYRSVYHKEEIANSYLEEDANLPFDLKNGPLIRASILQLSDDDYIFCCNLHHIISDGWSMDVLTKDVLAFYEHYAGGKQLNLSPLKIQYRDYASWQQEQLELKENTIHKAYWLKYLAGELPSLELPFQKVRPTVKSHSGSCLKTYISPEITHLLRTYGQNQGGSLFIGLLAVWNILFHKYTSDEDILIGTPIAGRDHSDLNDQIGFYINTLALRNTITPNLSFNSFYNKVKENTLLSFEHQMYPFDRLIEDLEIGIDTSRSALFDVMLMLHNTKDNNKNPHLNPSAFYTIEDRGNKVSKFDMDIAFQEEGDYLSFNITYNKDIYSKESVCQFINHYKQLLKKVLERPGDKIKDIEYLSEDERQELISDFNANSIAFPKDQTLIDLFISQALRTPESKALLYKNEQYTYKELDMLSSKLARCLIDDYDVKKGDFIGVHLERGVSVILSILGIMKAGGVYIPIDTDHPESRKSFIFEDTKIKLLISGQSTLNQQNGYKGIVFNTEKDFKPENYNGELVNTKLVPDDFAYIIYTSGSTGSPKGVIIEHKGILNTILAQIELFGISQNDNGLQFASFSFDASISEIFTTLLSGACLCVIDKEYRDDPKMLERYINDKKIDVATIPPSYLSLMEINSLKRLKTLITAGEPPIYAKVKEYLEFGNYYNAYGPTETSICSSMFGLKKGQALPLGNVPIGKPLANTQTFILDEDNKIVPIGIVGEICIGGVGVANGYLNNPDLTSKKFIMNPYRENERLYKTSDLGKWLPDGNIEFLGRKDDQVKVNGFRIELGEIEQALLTHNQINEAVVVVNEDPDNIKSLTAYIGTADSLSLEQLRRFLKNKLPKYCIPSDFISLKQLPLTINGKVDKKALGSTPGNKVFSEEDYVAPESLKEKTIIQIIAAQLGKEANEISIQDNFFDLGANSIKLIKILNEINKQLELDIKVVSLFENPNVGQLVQYLDSKFQEQEKVQEPEDISEALDKFINLM